MHVVQDAFESSDLPQGGVATIGNFDGVHRGQRAILDRVVERARELGVPSIVVTFDPHPLSVLRPERAPVLLTTPRQKETLLAEAGVAAMLVVQFNRQLAKTPARQFVRDFLGDRLHVQEIYVGEGFTFGFRREGNLPLLQEAGKEFGFRAHGVPELLLGGERISSTRIRLAISEGRVELAQELLGRAYSITGEVVRGDRMGQKLGWPTANLAPDNRLLPADGVYASRMCFPSYPATFDSVTNVGTRPTVYENYQRVAESHIFDFKSDVYGEHVELAFHKRLRDERIFPTVMDLSAQIGRDVDSAREFFARRRLEQDAPSGELKEE
jgi:riboflavin kinase / FMN adenylyltransferase